MAGPQRGSEPSNSNSMRPSRVPIIYMLVEHFWIICKRAGPIFVDVVPCRNGHRSGRDRYGNCKECARKSRRAVDAKPDRLAKKAARKRLRRLIDPAFRRMVYLDNQMRRAKRRGAAGSFTEEDLLRILRLQKRKCCYCKASLRSGYQIDHIVPLSAGGSNWPANLQLTCRGPCNQRKHSQDPVEFARSLGKLL